MAPKASTKEKVLFVLMVGAFYANGAFAIYRRSDTPPGTPYGTFGDLNALAAMLGATGLLIYAAIRAWTRK